MAGWQASLRVHQQTVLQHMHVLLSAITDVNNLRKIHGVLICLGCSQDCSLHMDTSPVL